MSTIFKEHVQKFVTIDDREFAEILSFFKVIQVRRKENILQEGQICKFHYFVLTGCLRKFFINEKGIEQTTDFAIERWWITDNMAYEHRQPTEFFIQAVENSDILAIEQQAQQQLFEQFPKMERYFRFIYQRAYAASEMRIKYLYEFSKEEFYHYFNERYPEFVQRIPKHLIASFLGFTPEYLSTIRKRNRS